jgi:hypothetical protein
VPPSNTVPAQGAGGTPPSVPVVTAAGAGLQRLMWDSVARTDGQTVVLVYGRGGCTGPALEATVTQRAGSIGVALWDGPRRPGQLCADFVTQATVSVNLPAPLAGRSVVDA